VTHVLDDLDGNAGARTEGRTIGRGLDCDALRERSGRERSAQYEGGEELHWSG
jgi:hypothetical protein